MRIEKAKPENVVKAIKTHDFSEVKKINAVAKRNARAVFDAVSSREVGLIYYDLPAVQTRTGTTSFFALHSAQIHQADWIPTAVLRRNAEWLPDTDI